MWVWSAMKTQSESFMPFNGHRQTGRYGYKLAVEVVLGGCDIDIFHPMPRYHCNDCEEEF